MTEEEKKAAALKVAKDAEDAEAAKQAEAEADAAKKAEEAAAIKEAVDKVAERDEYIKKIEEERDNYKKVALKRLGKLPGDADFLEGIDEKTGLTVEEQVKKTLLDRELDKAEQEKNTELQRLARENAELRLAAKNRPGGATIGSSSGNSAEVKDNVFSAEQLAALSERAKVLKLDPATFIATAKKNFLSRG